MSDHRGSEELVPVFVLNLIVLLADKERKKGSPLSEEEVLRIRDKAVVIALPRWQQIG